MQFGEVRSLIWHQLGDVKSPTKLISASIKSENWKLNSVFLISSQLSDDAHRVVHIPEQIKRVVVKFLLSFVQDFASLGAALMPLWFVKSQVKVWQETPCSCDI